MHPSPIYVSVYISFQKTKCQSKIEVMSKIRCFSFVLLAEKSLKVFDFYVRSIHSTVEGFVVLMMIRTMEREPVRCVVVVVFKFETGSGFFITGYKIVNTDLIF